MYDLNSYEAILKEIKYLLDSLKIMQTSSDIEYI